MRRVRHFSFVLAAASVCTVNLCCRTTTWKPHSIAGATLQIPSDVIVRDLPAESRKASPGAAGMRLVPSSERDDVVDIYVWPDSEYTSDRDRRRIVIEHALTLRRGEGAPIFRYHFAPGIARATATAQGAKNRAVTCLVAKRHYWEVYAEFRRDPEPPWFKELIARLDEAP